LLDPLEKHASRLLNSLQFHVRLEAQLRLAAWPEGWSAERNFGLLGGRLPFRLTVYTGIVYTMSV
jgi:hypothetical protein